MSSSSESGFGARLRHAQDILSFISGFAAYSPPRSQEAVAGFGALLTTIVSSNANETSLQNAYALAVAQRQSAFRGNSASMERLLSLIRGAVDSQYGKSSIEAKTVAAIIKQMRASKLIRPPLDPASAESAKVLSQSERSYGAMTQFFNDLRTSLAGFTGYNPSNVNIKLTALNSLGANLTSLSNAVATALLNIKSARASRSSLYDDLSDRVQRIKAYVKAQYGTSSNEYRLIKGIHV